jgi:hypothetical protein
VQAVDLEKKVLGDEHPLTLNNMANLAMTYLHQGRLAEAEKLGVQVLDIQKNSKALGPKYPLPLKTMIKLALLFISQSRWAEAEKLCVQVLDLQNVLG